MSDYQPIKADPVCLHRGPVLKRKGPSAAVKARNKPTEGGTKCIIAGIVRQHLHGMREQMPTSFSRSVEIRHQCKK